MAEEQTEAAEKRQRALNLRKAGATYDQVAAQAGYSNRGTAYRAVAAALRESRQDTREDVQQLESQRLDQMLMALWPKAMQGNGWAVDRILRMMEIRAGELASASAEVADHDPIEERRTVVEAVREDLADLPERLQRGALAAAALELARTIDQGLNQATCTKELRAVLADLKAQAPPRVEGDTVDDLNARRAARRRSAAAG